MRVALALAALLPCPGRAESHLRDPVRFAEVYICFAEEHASDLVSGFGHVFVCLPERPVTSMGEFLTSTAVNFSADTSPLGEGAWVGRYRVAACHELLRSNAFFQQRTVYFIRLRLSEADRNRLATELHNRLGKPYPYRFLTQNCGAMLADWILASCGKASDIPRPRLYFTPREAIERIVESAGADGFQIYRSSALRVHERAQALGTVAVDEARAAVRDISMSTKVSDRLLRLEVIRLNESRANTAEFAELQQLRRETTRGEEGQRAAAEFSRRDYGEFRPISEWVRSEEGPSVCAGAVWDSVLSAGLTFGIEAGLRDKSTPPVNSDVQRTVRFLALDLDAYESTLRSHVTMISMQVDRDFGGVFGSASSGFEFGYNDQANVLGTHGLYLSSIAGVSVRSNQSRLGMSVVARVDDIHSDARIRLLPCLGASAHLGSLSLEYTACSLLGEIGHRLDVASTVSVGRAGLVWDRSPDGRSRVEISLRHRF
ncbi:MAG: DUF4105 domain-containing protein [Bacteroidota bacterium]